MVIGDVAAKIAGPAQGGQPVRFCHRDVKPENLRLKMEGGKVKQVVLMDPGIMKLEDHIEDPLTRTGHFRGMEADPNQRYQTYEEFAIALYNTMKRYAG